MRLKVAPRLRFADQITGVDDYVESAATGLLAGRFAAGERRANRSAAACDHGDGGAPGSHDRPGESITGITDVNLIQESGLDLTVPENAVPDIP